MPPLTGGILPYAYRSQALVAKARVYDFTHHDSIEVVSMGDLHVSSAHVDLDMIRSAVDWLSEKDNRYAVIPGDVFDTAIKGSVSLDLSERGMSSTDARHLLTRVLQPVASRILAAIPGNHDDRQTRDAGSDEVDALFCALGVGDRYFPDGEAFLQFRVGRYSHNEHPVIYNCYLTHGNAGGRLPGGKVNSLVSMRQIVHNADCYWNGHGHDPVIKPEVMWEYSERGNVNERKQMFVSCGSSLHRKGYPVKKGYMPLARVFPTVTFHGGHKHMTAIAEH
jgi:hypothetical protein